MVDYISYSKENNAILMNQQIDFLGELGEKGFLVRNIVSDADKIEALGLIGLKRCKEYGAHKYKEEQNKEITESLLIDHVVTHADEKLLRLKDFFIRTPFGKLMASPFHNELNNIIDEMRKTHKFPIYL
eukprot:TRINITY_DN12797_c0_g1_i2.p1 TRINITY_DN12797_c0_g1~~TRINITY_DN12797_c0_g1_i2.p1  ORF type:complete len:129 (-),score=35.33 TRINITY_DN12797_c0_g1_i2:75-461(-)